MESITRSIGIVVLPELACMTRLLGPSQRRIVRGIHDRFKRLLGGIEELIDDGVIEPWHMIRLSEEDPEIPPAGKTLRVGIFPTHDDPLNWGHVLAGLSAIVREKLDKVIYAGQGSDETRREAGRALLGLDPLLGYCVQSDLASASLSLFALNPAQDFNISFIQGDLNPENHYECGYPPISHSCNMVEELPYRR
jgi:hypothetical protein